ncbi:hypothetical protein V1514DRAFT_284521 [Lipomyces japonicus]|uniref:uncharacterized protein n=1 Tax=Lipomyces japonicus TaxID=56871 RepID=UPI0034CE070A
MSLRYQVLRQYKELLYMGRDYPQGYKYFRDKLHDGFMKNSALSDSSQILAKLQFGEYMMRELEAFYHVRKYRSIKRSYYNEDT